MRAAAQTYCVIDINDLSNIDFSQIFETSEDTIKKSLDGTMFIIKFDTTPSFIPVPVVPLQTLTHAECLELVTTAEWSNSPATDE
tara:strand:- start:202 stop:456 length:255 start_codon:yes stop_codon:yes gene_type:complete